MLDEEEDDEDSIVSAHSDMNTPSVEPSDQASEFSASFSDVRILPGSMIVSSDDTVDSTVDRGETWWDCGIREWRGLNQGAIEEAE